MSCCKEVKSRRIVGRFLLALAFFVALGTSAYALNAGDHVSNLDLRDGNDNPAQIPDFGKKVIVMLYTDPDVADQQNDFADKLKAAKFSEDKYRWAAVANMKDAPFKPNSVIRMIVRKKVEKYKTVILCDPDLRMAKSWNLGKCNDLSVLIVVGKDGKVHHVKAGAMNADEIKTALDKIKELVEKS